MKVLVACEESQAICKAFREKGHEAYSCDIQECSGGHPEWHILGDVLPCWRCGGESEIQELHTGGKPIYAVTCKKTYCGAYGCACSTQQKAIEYWNTRPAPPVGRCKDCVWSREPTEEDYKELDRDLLSYKDSLVCDFWEREVWCKDFCSYFDKKEG